MIIAKWLISELNREGLSCGIPAEAALAWQRVIILYVVNRQPTGYLAHRSAICRRNANYTTRWVGLSLSQCAQGKAFMPKTLDTALSFSWESLKWDMLSTDNTLLTKSWSRSPDVNCKETPFPSRASILWWVHELMDLKEFLFEMDCVFLCLHLFFSRTNVMICVVDWIWSDFTYQTHPFLWLSLSLSLEAIRSTELTSLSTALSLTIKMRRWYSIMSCDDELMRAPRG